MAVKYNKNGIVIKEPLSEKEFLNLAKNTDWEVEDFVEDKDYGEKVYIIESGGNKFYCSEGGKILTETNMMLSGMEEIVGDKFHYDLDLANLVLDIEPHQLKHVEVQDEALVIKVMKKVGLLLKYSKTQTEKICLEAVKQNWGAFRYVRSQTEKICLEAVKQNGLVLQVVRNQTYKICLEAVKQNQEALRFVAPRFEHLFE